MSFYWTQIKNNTPRQCSICGNLYKAGYLNPSGEFFCAKDQRIRDGADISIGRISVWTNDELPPVLQSQLLGQVEQFIVENTEWWALVPTETITGASSFLDNFEMLNEYVTSYGLIYALAPREN